MNTASVQNMSEISCATSTEIAKKSRKQLKQLKLAFVYVPVLNKFQYKQCLYILKSLRYKKVASSQAVVVRQTFFTKTHNFD